MGSDHRAGNGKCKPACGQQVRGQRPEPQEQAPTSSAGTQTSPHWASIASYVKWVEQHRRPPCRASLSLHMEPAACTLSPLCPWPHLWTQPLNHVPATLLVSQGPKLWSSKARLLYIHRCISSTQKAASISIRTRECPNPGIAPAISRCPRRLPDIQRGPSHPQAPGMNTSS